MRKSIYQRSPQPQQLQPQQSQPQKFLYMPAARSNLNPNPLPQDHHNHNHNLNPVSQNSAIQEYLNMRRITKDKGCLIIFILYCIGLVIMLGIGFFFGNYNDLGYFVNDNSSQQENCNTKFLNENMDICTDTCASNYAFLGRVCIVNPTSVYNPPFTSQVTGLIAMNNIKLTFPMLIYVSAGLLVVTGVLILLVISLPKIIYLYTFALFLGLLGMAFYLLKNFELRVQEHAIPVGSIFYTEQQNTRSISFFFLGIYLLIFPFVLFSPKKIQLGTFLLSKISQFYKTMRKTIIFSFFIIVITWSSIIIQIFLVMHFFTSGTISTTPQLSMFHTYTNINLSHPASLVFHFIGVYWFYATLISWHKYFVSSAMCLWYFQDSQSMYQIRRGLKRSRHHVGSAAIDGLLMPLQWVFLFLYSVLKTNDNEIQEENEQSCVGSCFNSFRHFFMSIYNSINRSSPSSAVLTNQNYLESARNSAQIFATNDHRFFNIGGTLTIFLTLFICMLWVIIFYFIVYYQTLNRQFPPIITSIVLPILCIFLLALVIGSLFSNLFTASLDCLLYCYLMERKSVEDGSELERNDGQLKIKTVLDQCFYRSLEEARMSVFVYQEKDQNTMDITYIATKQ